MRQKHRVLIVDDSPDVLEVLDLKVSALGYEVSRASSAVEALGYLAHGLDPALIISDIQMPVLTGLEFAQMLRDRKTDIPLILMSGEMKFAEIPLAGLGVQAFLPKPLDFSELKYQIHVALGGEPDVTLTLALAQ